VPGGRWVFKTFSGTEEEKHIFDSLKARHNLAAASADQVDGVVL
jgi:hypothetical protein